MERLENMKTIFQIPHITVAITESQVCCVIIEDTELNDFVEDIFTEKHDLLADYISVDYKAKIQVYYNYFETADRAEIIDILKQFDEIKIEEIFRLNN